jgi:hypothetical protein
MVKRIRALILLVILALSVGVGTYVIWRVENPPVHLVNTPAPFQQTLINGNVTVDNEYFIQFTVPSSAFDITLSGNFSVLGEGTIRVVIVNETNFVSGFGLPTSYDSGQQTAGYLNVKLAPGATYFLVYDDYVQSSNSQPVKTVNTDIDLNYWYT